MTLQQLQNWTGYIELPVEHTESEARAIAENLGLTVTQTRIGYKDPNGIKYICTSFGQAFLAKSNDKAVFMKTIPLSDIGKGTHKLLRRKAAWLTALAVAGIIAGATFVIWVASTHKEAVFCVIVVAGTALCIRELYLNIREHILEKLKGQ